MCGRFSLAYEDWSAIIEYFQLTPTGFEYPRRYNIAPGQEIPAVISDGAGRRIGQLRWGLIPAWSADGKGGFKMINARAETLLVKPAFKRLVARKRCLIPADGFYEWRRADKQPFRFTVKSRKLFTFAGLYDTWTSDRGDKVHTCTIITCEPNSVMAPVHNRMPVILSREGERKWLDVHTTDVADVGELLQPYPESDMDAYPVSRLVGNVKNDVPECIALERPLIGD